MQRKQTTLGKLETIYAGFAMKVCFNGFHLFYKSNVSAPTFDLNVTFVSGSPKFSHVV